MIGEDITKTADAMDGRLCISLESLGLTVTMTHGSRLGGRRTVERGSNIPFVKVFGNFLWLRANLASNILLGNFLYDGLTGWLFGF